MATDRNTASIRLASNDLPGDCWVLTGAKGIDNLMRSFMAHRGMKLVTTKGALVQPRTRKRNSIEQPGATHQAQTDTRDRRRRAA